MRDEQPPAVTGKTDKAKGWGEAVGMDYIRICTYSRNIETLKRIIKNPDIKKHSDAGAYRVADKKISYDRNGNVTVCN